jgi:hypothetical protein
MSSRRTDFFMTLDEFVKFLNQSAKLAKFIMISKRDHDRGLHRPISTTELSNQEYVDTNPYLFILSISDENPSDIVARLTASNISPIVCQPPRMRGNSLILSSISIKTQWYDARSGNMVTDNSQTRLYSRLVTSIRKILNRPMWAYNVHVGTARLYRDLGYSVGAESWLANGGDLRQDGVDNVRFAIQEPTRTG